MKTCTKCGETKSRAEFNNSTSKKCKDGKFPWCKKCVCDWQKEWRVRNAERISKERRAKYAANPEPYREFMRKRYLSDPAARCADSKKWRDKNPDKYKAMQRSYYVENAEAAKAAARDYHFANREKSLAGGRARSKVHYEKNKDLYYLRAAARRVMKSGSLGKLSRGIRKRLFLEQDGRCVYCSVDLGRSAHLDHRVPLAKGGAHDDDNVQLLCSLCNLSKGSKMPDEFIKYRELRG